MILVDSDILIDVLRGFPPAVAWLEGVGEEEILLPGYVVMELMQGCHDKGEQAIIEKMLREYAVVWPAGETCDQALGTFATYHLSHKLGLLDALIAQLAVSLRMPLHTFNQKHYDCVPGLTTTRPYEK